MSPDYLDTRQLQAFVAVVLAGSMTGAAKVLGRSQSAISRLIQDLEADIGFAVLHRNGPRITPTEQGVALFGEAELFLEGLRTIGERARLIASGPARPLVIAATPALAASIVPPALADIAVDQFPPRVQIQSIAGEKVVQAVTARTADIGIASLPLENPGVEVHWLGEVPCVAVVSHTDPLATCAVVRPEDLAGRRLIVAANPYRLRLKIDQALAEQQVAAGGRIESNTTYVSLSLVRAGLGVAIVEPVTLSGLRSDGLAVLPISFPIPFRWGVITAIGAPLPANTEQVIQSLLRHAARLPGFRRFEGQSSSDLS